MRVRWRLTKACHAAISFEVVEWSEQLRPVTSIWLGAVRRSVPVRLCTSGCMSKINVWCNNNLLSSIVLIKSRPSLAVFLLSSLRLSYFIRIAMVVGSSIAVTPLCIAESDPERVSDGESPKLATRPFLLKWSSGLSIFKIGDFRLARHRSP